MVRLQCPQPTIWNAVRLVRRRPGKAFRVEAGAFEPAGAPDTRRDRYRGGERRPGPSAFSRDRQRALVEPLRLAVPALAPVHVGQIVEGLRHLGVVAPEHLLFDRERTLVEPLGIAVLALAVVH